uniref:Uncharacterized protein n=1 Tax=Tetranychus urticae TaxID=32264 RepID=T1K362_TETUR
MLLLLKSCDDDSSDEVDEEGEMLALRLFSGLILTYLKGVTHLNLLKVASNQDNLDKD